MTIQDQLFLLQDKKYAKFQSGLTPTIDPGAFIGVRVPEVRKLAKSLMHTPEAEAFLRELPHSYYDENMLHGLLISEMKDYDACLEALAAFLPFVDNWAVCDIMSPRVFKKHKQELLGKIREWSASEAVYTCRFGLEMLMTHYLDGDFRPEYPEIPAAVRGEDYYVRMMVAWFFATALAKQWEASLPYLLEQRLPVWTHNKTIQKAIESNRIPEERKAYLRTLKRRDK